MTPSRPSSLSPAPSRSGAFTLVEMLVVIGIILLLSAISFPVFKSIQERGAQTTCASNLQQIYLAVRLYKDDEREYPSSLAVLLPDTETLPSPSGTPAPGVTPAPGATPPPGTQSNSGGTGYFRKTREELVCPDDDFQTTADASGATPLRSSYADVTTDNTQAGTVTNEVVANNMPYTGGATHNAAYYGAGDIRDWGRTSWNFWGYDDWGQGFRNESEALAYFKALPPAPASLLLRNDKKMPTVFVLGKTPGYAAAPAYAAMPYYNPRGFVTDIDETNGAIRSAPYEEPREANMFKYSLSNPQAPLGTIITHCVFHRLQTAKNVITPGPDQLYTPTTVVPPSDGTGARDIILRLDGTARSYDVSRWNDPQFPSPNHGSNWQNSDF